MYVNEMATLEDSLKDDPLRKLATKDHNKLKVFASVSLHSEKFNLVSSKWMHDTLEKSTQYVHMLIKWRY